jgi:hypothetical protein
MDRRRIVQFGSTVWAAAGAGVALASLSRVNDDARVLAGLASVVFPMCALCAAMALGRRHDRLAGLLLVVSVATPTYFAYPLNVPALVVGLTLLVSPRSALGDGPATPVAGAPLPR